MSYIKRQTSRTAEVLEGASMRAYDKFHDYDWAWKPWLRRNATRSRRKLKPMTYSQLVNFMTKSGF